MSGTLKLSFVIEAVDAATAKLAAIHKAVERVDAPTKKLAASTRALMREAGWDKVLASMGPVRERTAGLINTTQNLALAYGAATAAAGGLFALLKGNIDKVDQANDQAKKLGISVEAYQKFGYAAQLNGASADEAGQALQHLARNMIEARNGSKEAAVWFARVGIPLGQLGKMNVLDVWDKISDKFQAVGDAGQNAEKKITLLTAVTGRSGANLKQLADIGSKGLRTFYVEAQRLGAVVDTDTAEAMADFNDNFDRLKFSIFGVVASISKSALPALDAMVRKFTEMNASKRLEWGQRFGTAIGQIITALPGFMSAVGQIGAGMAWAATKADMVAQALGGWEKVIKLVTVLLGMVLLAKVVGVIAALGNLVLAFRGFLAVLAPLGLGLGAIAWPVVAVLALVAGTAALITYWDELIVKAKQLEAAMPAWLRDKNNWLIPSLFGQGDAAAPAAVASALPRGRAPFKDGLSGTLKIDIDAEGRPRVRDLKQSPGGMLAFDVSLGIPMAGL